MSSVYFDPEFGGDGSTVTDDSDPGTGLANGGHRDRFVPALQQTVNVASFAQKQAQESKVWRDEAEDIASAVADVDVTVKFFDTYALAVAGLGGLSEADVVEVLRDENYDGQRVRYLVQSNALVLQFVANKIDLSDFAYLTQNKSLGWWVRRAMVADGVIPQASVSVDYNFTDRTLSKVLGESVDIDSAVSFSRASTAWGYGFDRRIKLFSSGEKRYVFDPVTGRSLGFLIEKRQRKNDLLHNRDLSQGVWAGSALIAKDAVGLDGAANSAHTVTDNNGASSLNKVQSLSLTANTDPIVADFYFEKDEDETRMPAARAACGVGEQRTVHINTATGATAVEPGLTTGGSHIVVDKGFYWKLSIVVANNNGASLAYYIYPSRATTLGVVDTSATGSVVYDFGGVEKGVSVSGEPIETGASAVTQAAESATDAVGAEFNAELFGVVIDVTAPDQFDNFSPVFEYSDGSSDNVVRAMFYSDGTLRTAIISGGVTQFTHVSPAFESRDAVRLALRIESDNFGVSINGSDESSGTGVMPLGISQREFGGASQLTSGGLNSALGRIREYAARVSAHEMAEVSVL